MSSRRVGLRMLGRRGKSLSAGSTDQLLLHNVQAMLLPRLEAAVHFHYGITLRGELHRGVGAHMTVLGIAVCDVHRIPAQTGQGAPFFLGKIDRPGDMALLE